MLDSGGASVVKQYVTTYVIPRIAPIVIPQRPRLAQVVLALICLFQTKLTKAVTRITSVHSKISSTSVAKNRAHTAQGHATNRICTVNAMSRMYAPVNIG
jgi:hypothetical protein